MSIVQRMRTAIYLLLLLLIPIGSACNAPAPAALDPSVTSLPTDTLVPTATVTPTITPTPTPSPSQRLDEAHQARFYGDWERALELYESIRAATGDLNVAQEASFGIALTYLQDKRHAEAIQELSTLINEALSDDLRARAHLLRGDVRTTLEEYAAAADDYQAYLALRPGVLDADVGGRLGNALFAAGDYPRAQDAFAAALLAADGPEALTLEIMLARSYARDDQQETALAIYNDMTTRIDEPYTLATLDYLMGLTYAIIGRQDEANERFLHAVNNYPDAYDSYASLVQLVEAGVPVDEYQRGIVDYYAGQYGVAIAAFDRFIAGGGADVRPEALYFRGLSKRATGDYAGALSDWSLLIAGYPSNPYWDDAWEQKAYTEWAYLEAYDSGIQTLLGFVDAVPDHPRAAEFLFDAAMVRERMNWLDNAIMLWERLVAVYPSSSYAYRAQFLTGVARYRQANYDLALSAFEAAFSIALEPFDQAQAQLWVGKSAQAQGDSGRAEEAWQAAAAADPDGYYSLRAAELLDGRPPFQSGGVPDFSLPLEPMRLAAEAWLRLAYALEHSVDLSTPDALALDARFVRGNELWALGRYGDAQVELEALRLDLQTDPVGTYRFMNHALDLGLYRSAIYAARTLMDMAESLGGTVPSYFERVRFGPYFGDLIVTESLDSGLDSLFVFSVVRQESLFESFATSYAFAYGLMQVIPDTGDYLRLQLGWPPDYEADDLYRPVVSVRFGTAYLAIQADLFDGDPYAMLAAYNAGPGNALIWQADAQGDPDLFLEIIRLSQPQNYIRSIAWAFSHYQDLYLP